MNDRRRLGVTFAVTAVNLLAAAHAYDRSEDPPALNPFGVQEVARDDTVPGYVELSDGSIHVGRVFLTCEARLKVYDEQEKRAREVPLTAVKRVEATVDREWLEKEWRFRENANDEKVYTGRAYPAREYRHTIVLNDGRTITGTLSAIVYVQAEAEGGESTAERFLLHKRDKGEPGLELKALTYVRTLALGEEAQTEGLRKVKGRAGTSKPKAGKKAARRPSESPKD